MRFRTFMLLLAALVLLACPALSDVLTYGDTEYIYPEEAAAEPTLLLSVWGDFIDPAAFARQTAPAPEGAVFGVYAKTPAGDYTPFPDPADPSKPLRLTPEGAVLTACLPLSVDLYLRAEAAPAGYRVPDTADAYLPLNLPGEISFTFEREHMQALRVTLTEGGETGGLPLGGVSFVLEGEEASYAFETDRLGSATLVDLPAGSYTLTQQGAPEGYQMDTPAFPFTLAAGEAKQLSLSNSRHGVLSLATLGLTVGPALEPYPISLARRYEVLDAGGARVGTLRGGETLSLPALKTGTEYTLRAAEAPDDGFAADLGTHTVTLVSGEISAYTAVVESTGGTFAFAHVSSLDGGAVPGGTFRLINAQEETTLEFTADVSGVFVPDAPLPAGQYTLQMLSAADGYIYSEESLYVYIEPYFEGEHAVAQATFVSQPVPQRLFSPVVTAAQQHFPSQFEQAARVDFTFVLFGGEPLPLVSNVSYAFDPPAVAGLSIEALRADGATLFLPRVFPLEGAETPTALTVSGMVSYVVTYPSGVDEQVATHIDAPFTVTVATFAAPAQAPSYAVFGHVSGVEGEPVFGLSVTLEDGTRSVVYEEVQTDPYGAYAFERLPEGAIVCFDAPEGYGALIKGMDAVIRPLEHVSGRVVVHAPVEGMPVTLMLGNVKASPQADGTFTLSGVFPQEESLRAETPEGIHALLESTGHETLVHLYAEATAQGQVAGPQGEPIEGARITFTGPTGAHTAQSDASGAYAVQGLIPGTYTLTLQAPEGYILVRGLPATLSIEAGATHSLSPVLMMRPAEIEGTLTEGGTPLSGISVMLEPSGLEAVTDETGRFFFAELPLGEYTLVFSLGADTTLLHAPDTISVTASGERIRLTLEAARAARIAGRVWYDENDDGLLSSGESGLSGAVVTLQSQGQAVASVTTGTSGAFSFDGLLPGEYAVAVSLPEGMIFSREAPDVNRLIVGVDSEDGQSAPIPLGSGDVLEGLICGATLSGSISGLVFEDFDGNGYFGAEDTPVQGITVTLAQGGQTVHSAVTDAAGQYLFQTVRAGDYAIQITLPDGYVFTAQGLSSGQTGSHFLMVDERSASHDVSVRRWRITQTVNAGMVKTATLRASAWLDEGATGQAGAAAAFSGITVSLYRILGSSQALVQTMETDAAGYAVFSGLRPGQYRAYYALPGDAWGFSAGVESALQGGGYSGAKAVLGGAEAEFAPAFLTRLGAISGIVFADGDYDGLRGDEEGGLSAAVTLLDASGGMVAKAQTAADGAYAFSGLLAGQYTVRFELPDGYVFTKNRPDAPSFNSDVPETAGTVAKTAQLYLPMGETMLVDAGAYRPGSIAGSLWQDMEGTGLYASQNPPLAGFTVTLMREGVLHAQTATDENGAYAFECLPPGEYTVLMEMPAGSLFSAVPEGAGRANKVGASQAGYGETAPLSLAAGQNLRWIDGGVRFLAALSGTVYNDKDGMGMEGVTVRLSIGGALLQTVTDAAGTYRFSGVTPGSGQIQFALPGGYLAAPEYPEAALNIVLQQKDDLSGLDMHLMPEGTLDGFLWLDADQDGVRADDEPFVGDTMIELLMHTDEGSYTVALTGTGSDGAFRFDGLYPGTYSLRFSPPENILVFAEKETSALSLGIGDVVSYPVPCFTAAYLCGTVFEDLNRNGRAEEDEPGLMDVRVELLAADGRVLSEKETDPDGFYLFNELPPGEYAVRFILPDGYLFTDAASGGSVVRDTVTGKSGVLTLAMGEGMPDVHAGLLRYARVGDLVWLDENGNGMQETSEPGIAGVPVTLWLVTNDGMLWRTAETVTDANGRYRFDQVPPGQYRVSFTVSSQYLPTRPDGAIALLSSKLAWKAGDTLYTETFLVPSGGRVLTVDAGLVTPESAEAFGWTVAPNGAIAEE